MTPVPPAPNRRRRWLRGWWWKLPLALLLLLVPAYFLWHAYLDREYQNELARIRAAGHPASVDELERYFHDGGPNPAPLYAAAFDAVLGQAAVTERGVTEDWHTAPERGQPLSPEILEAKRAAVELNAEALRLVREANAAEGEVWFDVDYRPGPNADLRHFGPSRAVANALTAEAYVAAARDDAEAAADAVLQTLELAEALANEPTLLGQLVRLSIYALATGAVEDLLQRVDFSDADLLRLQQRLRQSRERMSNAVHDGLIGDRVIAGLTTFRLVTEDLQQVGIAPSLMRRAGLFKLDRLLYLDLSDRQISAAGKPRAARPDIHSYVEWKLEQDRVSIFHRTITRIVLFHAGGAMRMQDRIDAKLRVSEVAAAVERFRRDRGRLPRTLDELVPTYLDAVPADPWDEGGGPVRLRVVEAGPQGEAAAVIYSVGYDGVDNGGRERDAQGQPLQPGTDITFTLGDAQQRLFPADDD